MIEYQVHQNKKIKCWVIKNKKNSLIVGYFLELELYNCSFSKVKGKTYITGNLHNKKTYAFKFNWKILNLDETKNLSCEYVKCKSNGEILINEEKPIVYL